MARWVATFDKKEGIETAREVSDCAEFLLETCVERDELGDPQNEGALK